MEPQKRARYSKLLDAEELEEILMEEESDEELEDTNEFIQPRANMLLPSSSSSSDEAEETEIRFRDRRPRNSPKVLDFTGPQSGINRSAAPNINAQSSPFSIFFGYTYDMTVYLGKQRQLATEEITQTHGIVLQLIQREGLGHKICMDNYFVKGHLSVVHWKDKHDVYVQMNLQPPPLEGNFRDESGHAVNPHVIEDYNAHIGFADKSDRMINSYGIPRRTWKRTKKLLFHLLDMTIPNAYLLHKSCSGKMTHKKF
ncbi:hypothetical protein B7P43_G17914 [Cryptotermes secundus]|uniref:PiggyBac transposable element-derived protein domain-containing protein n=1 Tax=Cryptotermes secundus TaxID=105785 RepID=A0A2J7RCW7_9NEOP|nr:hypothetical protein B7P43_G17914 [Cryptotermes secundus]